MVNLVKVLPGTTVLLSAVNIEDGVIRLFRDWLKSQARRREPGDNDSSTSQEDGFLWADQSKNVGLKFRVQEVTKLDSGFPVLVHRDEESFSSYEIVIEGISPQFHFFKAGLI